MNGFSVLFFIFATCVLLVGIYMYTGHEFKAISWKAAFKGIKKDGWKNVGKWTMITSILIYIIAILGLIFHFE